MRTFIVHYYPLLTRLTLFACLALSAAHAKALALQFQGLVTRKGLITAALLFLLALAARLWLVPHTHYVYFDEFEHVNIAQNLARSNAFAESLAGGTGDWDVLSPPLWPAGFHTMLSLAFSIFGPSEAAAFNLNAVIGSLSVLLVFFLAAYAFKDERTGLLSAFFLALSPSHLQYSGSADLTVASLFWILAALIVLLISAENEGFGFYLLFLATLLYAVHSRLENFILIPIFWVYRLAKRRGPGQEATGKHLCARLFFLIGLIPIALLIILNIRSGLPGYGHSLSEIRGHFAHNGPANLRFFLNPASPYLILVPLFCLGLARAAGSFKEEGRLLAGMLILFFVFYSCYHIGDFSKADSLRYSLILDLPIILLASLGLSRLVEGLRWKEPLLIAVLTSYALLTPFPRPPDSRYEQEYRFILSAAGRLPREAYVISYSPAAILSAARRPAVSPYVLLESQGALEQILPRGGSRELVLFKDYWWHERRADSALLEERLRKDYEFSALAKATIDAKEYAFYRLKPRAHPAPPGR